MSDFFDLNQPAGQFRAVALIYLLTVLARACGCQWIAQDQTLFAGALLTLLRGHIER